MDKRLILSVLLMLGVVGTTAWGGLNDGLAGWWRFEGNFNDSAGTNHGTAMGDAKIVTDAERGRVVEFDGNGDYVEVPNSPSLNITGDQISLTAWVCHDDVTGTPEIIIAKVFNNTTHSSPYFSYGLHILNPNGHPRVWISRTGGASNATNTARLLTSKKWHHLAGVYDGAQLRLYIDGEQVASSNVTGNIIGYDTPLLFGINGGRGEPMDGKLDEVRIYNRALSVEEIAAVMAGAGSETGQAADPSPAAEAVDVPVDTALSWTPGEFAATHDVYLGTTFADANDAGRSNPMGVLAGQGQADTAFTPSSPLEFGRTYFWRIDEVNAAPDNKIFKGEIWSFTTEPYAYPLTNVTATASGSQAGTSPDKTIDGSGLNAGEQHSTELTDMWMSAGGPPDWIQYEFDKVYKLHEMAVWNSNQLVESFVGFGAKSVTIEYSVDGATWSVLEGVPEFARATGAATYTANTIVDFGGVLARFVKLTIESNWGGLTPQTGLSEVRFFHIPVQARRPQPADGATGVDLDTDLNWRPGREAQSHDVYVGMDRDAVAAASTPVATVTAHEYAPGALDLGTTYFWRVDEVGAAGVYEGDLWSFTTQEYTVVEDFESYNDDDNRIYNAWIDGYADSSSGSVVGNLQAPFAEQTIVHGGKQSMPLAYDNSASPFYSEAQRTFDNPQDLTANGADALRLHVRGRAAPGTVQYDAATQTYTISGAGGNIWGQNDEFHFAFKELTGDGSITVRVDGLSANPPHGDPRIGVMIRDTLDPNAANATLFVEPDPRTRLTQRIRTADNTTDVATAAIGATPTWLRLTRQGFIFRAERSDNGTTWAPLLAAGSEANIAMTDPVYIGLVVCSHAAGQFIEATFSNVKTTGPVSPAGPFTASRDVGIASNSPQPLYVTLQDTANRTKTVMGADLVTALAWTAWDIPLADFAPVNAAAVKTIILGVGDRGNPASDGAGLVYLDDIQVVGLSQ